MKKILFAICLLASMHSFASEKKLFTELEGGLNSLSIVYVNDDFRNSELHFRTIVNDRTVFKTEILTDDECSLKNKMLKCELNFHPSNGPSNPELMLNMGYDPEWYMVKRSFFNLNLEVNLDTESERYGLGTIKIISVNSSGNINGKFKIEEDIKFALR
jgi:hypothetical protein